MDILSTLTAEFHLAPDRVRNVVGLIDGGNTIPFIARYRKEMTGSLDDQVLRELAERLETLRGLEKRREEIRKSIASQEALTDEIDKALEAAVTVTELEDIYRPYRPKRRTRATVAREKGLEPLAVMILLQKSGREAVEEAAAGLLDPARELETVEDAVAGALDIIAEDISDDAALRKLLRTLCMRSGLIASKAAKKEDSVYRLYYDYREAASRIPGHRVLAVDRGEREGYLKVSVELEPEEPLARICAKYIRSDGYAAELVRQVCADAYARLIFPAIEREVRGELTERAQEAALKVFAANLKQLLLQPPVRGKAALGLDPAYRTGCKAAVVDATGKVLETTVIYPTPPQSRVREAKETCLSLIERYNVDVIAIGNGTASRETEQFTADMLKEAGRPVSYMVVSEAGASVYSASKLGAQEFPDFDVSLRSAVSIARRLQDPLAELVKIDPKAIGVGQYQHDLKAARLDEALGGVVEDCVNSVGVDLNTASWTLLSHVAGVNMAVARSIVAQREENGPFRSRRELLKVPKLGPKAYEQCAGFLRIPGSESVLDATSVHPESYAAARKLLERCGRTLSDVAAGNIGDISAKIKEIGEADLAAEIGTGVPTLRDIVAELMRPGRDPRDELPKPLLRTDVLEMKDLRPGMELTGTVRNVIDFGAFVDIGVHQDGLVHISQICDRFIRHPSEALKVGDIVRVRVLEVDPAKKRISLTMKSGG